MAQPCSASAQEVTDAHSPLSQACKPRRGSFCHQSTCEAPGADARTLPPKGFGLLSDKNAFKSHNFVVADFFLLFAYSFLFALCLFTDPPKMQQKKATFKPPQSFWPQFYKSLVKSLSSSGRKWSPITFSNKGKD